MMAKAALILDDELFARAFNRPPYGKPDQSAQQIGEPAPQSTPTQMPAPIQSRFSAPRGKSGPHSQAQISPTPAATQIVPHSFPPSSNRAQVPNQPDVKARPSPGDAKRGKALSVRLASNKRRSDKWPAVRWTAAGFIVGIVFWHVVGFWEFISKVVLDDGHIAVATHSHRPRPNAQNRLATTQPSPTTSLTRKLAVKRQPSVNIVTGSIDRARSAKRDEPVGQYKPKMAITSGCIMLVRDPNSRTTISLPCAASVPAPTVSSGGARVDRQLESAGSLSSTATQ